MAEKVQGFNNLECSFQDSKPTEFPGYLAHGSSGVIRTPCRIWSFRKAAFAFDMDTSP